MLQHLLATEMMAKKTRRVEAVGWLGTFVHRHYQMIPKLSKRTEKITSII